MDLLCEVFEVSRSAWYAQGQRRRRVDMARVALKGRVQAAFSASRGAAGSRTVVDMLRQVRAGADPRSVAEAWLTANPLGR